MDTISFPALRETQLVVDPNYNTTSTSIRCNTDALSAYPVHTHGPEYSYKIDGDCDLIYVDARGVSVYVDLNSLERMMTMLMILEHAARDHGTVR